MSGEVKLLPCPFCGKPPIAPRDRVSCVDGRCPGCGVTASAVEWNTRQQPEAGREGRLRMFLEILSKMGGQSDASDYAWSWTNAFCDDGEPDTFNLAIDRGFTRSTHDSDTDHSMVYLTEAGRGYLAATRLAVPTVVGREEVAEVDLSTVLTEALYFAVCTLAFHGRDRGTDRQEQMLDDLEKLARDLDPRIRFARKALLSHAEAGGIALADIAAERARQISAEGWSLKHDDEHELGELAMAAALYAAPRPLHEFSQSEGCVTWHNPWPWFRKYWLGREQAGDDMAGRAPEGDGRQKHSRRRQLVIAGALIVAEIERLDRAGGSDGDPVQ